MLKNRIITAVILIPIVVAFIFLLERIWFSALFSVFVAIGAWEWGIEKKVDNFAEEVMSQAKGD